MPLIQEKVALRAVDSGLEQSVLFMYKMPSLRYFAASQCWKRPSSTTKLRPGSTSPSFTPPWHQEWAPLRPRILRCVSTYYRSTRRHPWHNDHPIDFAWLKSYCSPTPVYFLLHIYSSWRITCASNSACLDCLIPARTRRHLQWKASQKKHSKRGRLPATILFFFDRI